ncbi:MAG: type I 3-dehydroquinate dehydratase, partial [Thermoanaerobaculia bacterium]
MQLFVTIREESADATLRAIRAIDADHDGVEVRAEELPDLDFAALRGSTVRPIILTYRGRLVDGATLARAIEAGIDFVDVEFRDGFDRDAVVRHRERVVLSHHDFEGMERVEEIVEAMDAFGCAHVKVAVTPRDFASNVRLLRLIAPRRSIIGMGERGLYTRILAPFRGSALTFAAAADAAAPSQLTLENALAIYGRERGPLRCDRVFAVAGNPAGHSLSPALHNGLFREKKVSAAYTIASVAAFGELEESFLGGEPCGLSVTAPFKEDALRFAQRIGAAIGSNAIAAGAVNTLVNAGGKLLADNTDVDGFETLIARAGDVRSAA